MILKPITHQAFICDVVEFCRKHNFSERRIGVEALNDSSFFLRIKSGKSPTLQRVERIYDFMIKYEKDVFSQ